jgi:phosphatidylglycerophosphate synthase
VSARSPRPTIAELRAATQPATIFARNSGEHWAGKLYVRRFSPYVTRALVPTRVTPNAVTWGMIVVGALAALVLTLPGVLPALAAALLIQVQILLDCADGELARWRKAYSTAGIYLDRFGHYLTETLLPIALGIRADGGWDELGGTYTSLGLLAAVLALMVRMEAVLVTVARTEAGLPKAEDTAAVAAPRAGGLRALRRMLGAFPFFRAFVAIEATLLALLAALLDVALGDLEATRVLVVALVPIAAITAAGRLLAILTSERLR